MLANLQYFREKKKIKTHKSLIHSIVIVLQKLPSFMGYVQSTMQGKKKKKASNMASLG